MQSVLTITCPNDVSTDTTGCNPAAVTYPTPGASGPHPIVSTICTPTSGSNFTAGITQVFCTATDSTSATASCSFTVTVQVQVSDRRSPSR